MLKRTYRLGKKTNFNNAHLLSAPQFIVKIKPNKLLFNRFGIIISKKIDKRAVVRNRVKRRINSCIQDLYDIMKPGYDMLFIIRKGVLGQTKKDLYLAIKKVLEKEGLLK